MLRLLVREGGTSRTVRVEGDAVSVGTAPPGGIRIAAAGVDRVHCRIQRDGLGGLQILDLGSREGTILNGRRVTRAPLATGDEVLVGAATVSVLEAALAAPATPAAAASFTRRADDAAGAAPGATRPPAGPGAATVPAAGARASTFEESLYAALRGSPPWAISVVLHGAVALALLLAPPRGAESPGPLALRLADAGAPAPALEDEREERVPLAPPRPVEPPRVAEEVDLIAEAAVTAPGALAGALAAPPDATVPALVSEFGFGAGPGAEGGVTAPVRAVRFEGNPAFEGSGAPGANRTATGLLRGSLGGDDAIERRLAAHIDPRRLLVVEGAYDHVEELLGVLGLRHDTIRPEDLAYVPLDSAATLIIDCGNDALTVAGALRVAAFVESGGFLVTTDWGLENVIERAFPGLVRSLYLGGRGVITRNERVRIRLPRPGHPLVRGLRSVGDDAVWWIEDRAHPVRVLDAKRVTVLVESEEFGARYGGAALALTFPHGAGRVLHLVGHAWQREGNLKGTYGMQRLIANFLLERVRTAAAAPAGASGTDRTR